MAETIEIANAYVALTTKMPGVKKDIEDALGASDVQAAAEKSGSSLGGKLVKGVGGVAVGGIAAVAAAGIGTLSVALVKGFSRLEAIDDAGAKLRGLGHDAAGVEAIMSNALDSVRGTAYGLDEAATTAATAVAAGIKPGQDLTRYLKTIADTAAVAGADLGDVGRVMNNVTTIGSAYNDSLQILAQKGLPVYTWLAEAAGVSEGAIKELASQGAISSAELRDVLDKNLGGAALSMGETFSGAVSNMGASLSRIGAGLIGGVFSEFAPTIQAITAAMEPLEGAAGDLGQKLGEFLVPAFEWLRSALEGGLDFSPFLELASYLSPVSLLFQALKPLLPQVMDLFSEIGSVLSGAVVAVLPVVSQLAQTFIGLLSDLAAQVLPVLFPVLLQLVQTVGSLIPVLMPLVTTILTALAPLFEQVASAIVPILEPLLALITPLLSLVTTILPPLVNLLQIVISAGVMALQGALSFLLPYIEGVATMIGTVLTPVIETVQNYLSGLIEFITGVFTGDWEKAWNGIQEMFSAVWNGIWDIVRGVINGIIDLINGMLSGISGFGDFLSGVTGGTVDLNIGQIPHLANGGVVTGSSSGTLALIGEAGRGRDEAVIPLPPDWRQNGVGLGGGESTVNVYPSPGMDEYTIGVIAGRESAKAARGF